jgi:hypothetical protein
MVLTANLFLPLKDPGDSYYDANKKVQQENEAHGGSLLCPRTSSMIRHLKEPSEKTEIKKIRNCRQAAG